ncbi:hypothetical protein TWF730_002692 [Orbilia blumenaviensis]|uniref:Uncharacterized protein n=1 Tax=Orbilia blumenaviensis TaxID=1796055 RepID=A0AAV9U9J0_9PEZI
MSENGVETECDQTVDRLEVAAWYLTNGSTTDRVTTAGFSRVKVVLKRGTYNYYFLKTDSVKDADLKAYQSYKFQGSTFDTPSRPLFGRISADYN